METLEESNCIQIADECIKINEENDSTLESVVTVNSETSFNIQDLCNSTNCTEIIEKSYDEVIKVNGDGSDSGVEIGSNILISNCVLQRALSSNSGGYASSCGGLDENIGMVSCDSSMISCCSDLERLDREPKPVNSINTNRIDCCTSEGGSESSSVTGGPVTTVRLKKKVAVTEPTNKNIPKRILNETYKTRSISASRTQLINTKSSPNSTVNRDRARSRDKFPPKTPTNRSTPLKRPQKPDSFPVDIKDPASPAIQRLRGSRTPSITRGRTPGSTPTDDGRWPSIGGKGGNMSSSTGSGTPKSSKIPPDTITIKTRVGALALDNLTKSSSVYDKYATLPRRRKEKSADDLKNRSPRSNSISRDNNRMSISLVKKQITNSNVTTPSKTLPPYPKIQQKKSVPKTKIYHETSVQTAITSNDVDAAFLGIIKNIQIDAIEKCSKSTQSDIRDKQIESLEEKLKNLTKDYTNLQITVTEKSQLISQMEKDLIKEREGKLSAQKELHSNSERVLAMLESVHVPSSTTNNEPDGSDSLLILESQIMKSEHVLEKKEAEINKWKKLCFDLQNDMEKSLSSQRNLIEQRDAMEFESNELQDFLQTEKLTLVESLREVETEVENCKTKILQKDVDLERLQEECRHLVRISEQRRQENMGLQSKYSALESRSRELLLQQNTAVSGASVALAGLGSRLDHLVEQLITSYNISEQELEDVIYHNEAYTNSGSSGDGSPEFELGNHEQNKSSENTCDAGSLSPQRGHSFIAAVISAIKNATSSAASSSTIKMNGAVKKMSQSTPANLMNGARSCAVGDIGEESDSTEMLDSETEPCLMMENVLEDVTMPDSHSHNLVSTSGMILSQVDMPSDMKRHGGESLHNLSQAIENRQQIELQSSIMANRSVQHSLMMRQLSDQSTSDDISIHESIADIPSISEYCTAQSLVDQVIEVDNLVTKLLKILRIIQMDNDNCIQQLIGDKNKLQLNKEEMLERLRDLDEINLKLKDQLQDASENLIIRNNELAANKIELQRHRIEIDRLNEDICNLSTLCSQNMNNSNCITKKDDVLTILKTWQENGVLPEPEIINHIVKACNEIPAFREQLLAKETQINEMTNNLSNSKHFMASSWHTAVNEAKRQYEAIDRALETLNSIQSIVQQCPALAQLQQDLEETNFQSASSLPLSTALLSVTSNGSDFNANGNNVNGNVTPPTSSPISSNNSSNNLQINNDQNNQTIHEIDSTA